MRIFTSFLIVLLDIFLWFLPVQAAIYDFRTDIRTDNFNFPTAVGVTTGNVVLLKPIYANDTMTLSITSSKDTDAPLFSSYNGITRLVAFTGLSDNSTRALGFEYDVASFDPSGALSNFMDLLPWFWMLPISIFPLAAIVYIFWGKGITGG